MTDRLNKTLDREYIFADMPVGRALYAMAAPTVISQLINLIYNMVDAFYIGRTGDPYKMAATTITISLMMLNVAFGNLYGIGGGLLRHAAETAREQHCTVMNLGIVEENTVLRKWYESHGAVHLGTKKYDFFPFTCGYMKIKP